MSLFQFIILISVQIALDGMLLLRQQLVAVLHGLDDGFQRMSALIQVLLLSSQPDLSLLQRLIVWDRVDVMRPLVLMQILYSAIVKQ